MDCLKILSELTLEEKAMLLSGKDFWHTNGLERLGIPSVMVTDGPHGLRKQGVAGDHLGIAASLPATCFPTAAATACSFDEHLMERIGAALGEECRKEDIAVLLGPAMNIKRNPLCGRNFEYISEDPLLTGRMAAAHVKGVQSKGVGTSLKHFAANSQEKRRNWQNSVVDERALREIYLRGFEYAVKNAHPWTMMTAYNRLNGSYCSENRRLMTEIAREEWGFDGLFVTDWGAMSDPVASFVNGLNLEMPGTCKGTDQELLAAIEAGSMSVEELDKAVLKVLELLEKYVDAQQRPYTCNMDAHLRLAQEAAEESAVLLKNDGALPLSEGPLLVIGNMAKQPRYQGSGSSKVCPTELDSFCKALEEAGISYDYAQGYPADAKQPDGSLCREAVELAGKHSQVVIFAGLTDIYESEGYDRDTMELPEAHNALIEAVAQVNPNTVVVLQGGSPVLLPWKDKVNGILLTYLSGCQGGKAAKRLLFGEVNPSGKLAETWPLRYEDVPNADTFGVSDEHIQYRESIYVGYRWYDAAKKKVAYPFGFGLSYTRFCYHDLVVDGQTVHVTVTNCGDRDGKETVQLYVGKPDSVIYRAPLELKGFQKVALKAGVSQVVTFSLTEEDLAVFDTVGNAWATENGDYTISIGASSRDIRLTATMTVSGGTALTPVSYPAKDFTQADFEALLGGKVPEPAPAKPFTYNTLLAQTSCTWLGKLILSLSVPTAAKKMGGDEQARKSAENMMGDMPIRNMGMGGGNRGMIHGLVDILNGHMLRGLKKIICGK